VSRQADGACETNTSYKQSVPKGSPAQQQVSLDDQRSELAINFARDDWVFGVLVPRAAQARNSSLWRMQQHEQGA
jgi:hypothetical protein